MEKETFAHSSTIQTPTFNCYKTVEEDYLKINPEKDPRIFRLFSAECKSKECFVMECPTQGMI